MFVTKYEYTQLNYIFPPYANIYIRITYFINDLGLKQARHKQ
jgi:hypothetical protein